MAINHRFQGVIGKLKTTTQVDEGRYSPALPTDQDQDITEFWQAIARNLSPSNREDFNQHCKQIKQKTPEEKNRIVDIQSRLIKQLPDLTQTSQEEKEHKLYEQLKRLIDFNLDNEYLQQLEQQLPRQDAVPERPPKGWGFGGDLNAKQNLSRRILKVGSDPYSRQPLYLNVGGDSKDPFADYQPARPPDSQASSLESWLTQFVAHKPEVEHNEDNPLGFVGQRWRQQSPKREVIELKPYATEEQPTLQYQNQHYGLPCSQGMYYYPDKNQLHSNNNDYSWETLSRLVAEGVCDLKADKISASDFTQEQAQQSCNQLPNDLKNKLINNLRNNKQFEDLSEEDMNNFLNQCLTPPLATYIMTGAMSNFYHVKAAVRTENGDETNTETCMKTLWQQYYSKSPNKDQDPEVTRERQDFAIFKELGFELMGVLREDVEEKKRLQHATKIEFN